MDSSNLVINPSGQPTRLQRFKDVCYQKRILKGRIEKLIEKRERIALRELEHAESELEGIKAQAADVRAQMKETRLADVGDTMRSEEVMSCNTNGSPNAVPLLKTADLEGGRHTPLDTPTVKDSARNSTSFTSAESPILPPSSDECSVVGSLDCTPFKLDRRSEDGTPTLPIAEEDGKSCEKQLESEARQYAVLCKERRALEMAIEKELADDEEMASRRVESARSSLQAARKKIAEIVAELKRASEEDTITMTMIDIRHTVSVDGLHGEDELELENTRTPTITLRPYSSEAKVNLSPSVSEASTHNKPKPASLYAPESPQRSHFERSTQEEIQATGSQILSVYKTRKKLTKKGHKQFERSRVVSQEEATPLSQAGLLSSVAGE